MSQPKISVIMPIFNGEKFIRPAINSLLEQKKEDWELIIIDDGSTDTTPIILDSYNDIRIIKMRQENKGEAGARNTGLDHATGQYIAFLDADDLYLPNALADVSEFLDSRPEYGVVFSDGYFCDEQGKPLLRLTEHRPGIFTGNILEALVLSPSIITVPVCTMTRRSVIEKYHFRFDMSIKYGTDWDFWIRMARVVHFGYLDIPTCMYRVHGSNMTRTSSVKKRKEDLFRAYLKILDYDWFSELSVFTRSKFFYILLIDVLTDQPAKQMDILTSRLFSDLPKADQAKLWRQVGINALQLNTDKSFASSCIHSSLQLRSDDWKTRALSLLLKLNQSTISAVIRLWNFIHHSRERLLAFGHRQPKPVPSNLKPEG